MNKLILFSILGFLFFSSFFEIKASAAGEYLGGKWCHRNVYWNFDSTVPSGYHTPARQAGVEWNGYANVELIYITDPAKNYLKDITVTVPANHAQWASQGYYGFGISIDANGDGCYDSSSRLEIISGTAGELASNERRLLLTHEFGHNLGLAHVTKWFTDSIMDESDVFTLDGPTSYDISNLRGLH